MTKQEKIDKIARFAVLSGKLQSLIQNELFISEPQKQELCDEIFGINKRVQAGMMRGIETRLHTVYNTLRQYRAENLFPSLAR
jgi:hypothetical protein